MKKISNTKTTLKLGEYKFLLHPDYNMCFIAHKYLVLWRKGDRISQYIDVLGTFSHLFNIKFSFLIKWE